MLAGRSRSEQEALLDRPLPRLITGRTYALSVTVTEAGARGPRDYTGSVRVAYESFGCLTLLGTRTLLVQASGRCSGPKFPSLWVLFMSDDGKPLAYNEYLFRASSK